MSKSTFNTIAFREILTLLTVLTTLSVVSLAQGIMPATGEKREVEKAWAALIRAKGGSERLHSVTNMVTHFSALTRLHVFPERSWEFAPMLDLSPSLDVYNGPKKTWYLAGKYGVDS